MVQQAGNVVDPSKYQDLVKEYESMPEDVRAVLRDIISPVADQVGEVFAAETPTAGQSIPPGVLAKAYAFGVLTGAIIVLVAKLLP
ncbi:MAG TPA: hypothetical protein VFK94_06395 [Patescibacteria group bacterium]|nr:hypothetical protein [Patescibacteria group bacterium]